ncbi:MAG: hypothetical protein CM1200mP2_43490 [Planctomycetaceae bacterium]|nr:MAG: hypothetical protein CM1200mP2_43490 [Planctomycetaceae bacterium]
MVPFERVLENIAAAARRWPLVIQGLFMRVEGEAPPESEIEAFCDRLCEITSAGGQLKLVQVYTVARPPAESIVTALEDRELQEMLCGFGRGAGWRPRCSADRPADGRTGPGYWFFRFFSS